MMYTDTARMTTNLNPARHTYTDTKFDTDTGRGRVHFPLSFGEIIDVLCLVESWSR